MLVLFDFVSKLRIKVVWLWNRDDEHEVLAYIQATYRKGHLTKKAVEESKQAV